MEDVPAKLIKELEQELKGVDRLKSTPFAFGKCEYTIDLTHKLFDLEHFNIEEKISKISIPGGHGMRPFSATGRTECMITFSCLDPTISDEFDLSNYTKIDATVYQHNNSGELVSTYHIRGLAPSSFKTEYNGHTTIQAYCEFFTVDKL